MPLVISGRRLVSIKRGPFGFGPLRGVLGKNLCPCHIMCFVGKAVILRFFVNKYLVIKNKIFTIVKNSDGHNVLIALLQSIKQMTSAAFTKSTLGPIRGVIYPNIFFSFKGNIIAAVYGQQRPAGPPSAHTTMARADLMTHRWRCYFHFSTKTVAFGYACIRHDFLLRQAAKPAPLCDIRKLEYDLVHSRIYLPESKHAIPEYPDQ